MNICLAVYCKQSAYRLLADDLLAALIASWRNAGIFSMQQAVIFKANNCLIFNMRALDQLWNAEVHWADNSSATSCSALPISVVDKHRTSFALRQHIDACLDKETGIEHLNAPFFAVRWHNDLLKVFSDPLGLGRAYCTDNDLFFAASNSIFACRFFAPPPITPNITSWRMFSALGWFTDEDTPVDHVRRISPSTVITTPPTRTSQYFTYNKLICSRLPQPNQLEVASNQMSTLCANVATLARTRPRLLLSGGRDSRVSCAAYISSNTAAKIVTIGTLNQEAEVAKQLMQAVGGNMEHSIEVPKSLHSQAASYLQRFCKSAQKWEGDGPPIKGTSALSNYRPAQVVIGGGGGEIAHGNYYPSDAVLSALTNNRSPIDRLIRFFTRTIGRHATIADQVSSRLLQIQNNLSLTGIVGPSILDGFYLVERFRRWVAAGHECHSVIPFACAGFVRLAFDACPAMKRQASVHRALADLFIPGWGSIPFYKAKSGDQAERTTRGLRMWQSPEWQAIKDLILASHELDEVFDSVSIRATIERIDQGESYNWFESAIQRVLWYHGFAQYSRQLELVHGSVWRAATSNL